MHTVCLFLFRFGRHPVLIISVFFMLVFGFTVAFSVNVPMFSTLRFFEGFCLAGISLSLYVLSEYLHCVTYAHTAGERTTAPFICHLQLIQFWINTPNGRVD